MIYCATNKIAGHTGVDGFAVSICQICVVGCLLSCSPCKTCRRQRSLSPSCNFTGYHCRSADDSRILREENPRGYAPRTQAGAVCERQRIPPDIGIGIPSGRICLGIFSAVSQRGNAYERASRKCQGDVVYGQLASLFLYDMVLSETFSHE